MSGVINPHVSDGFVTAGVTFRAESDKQVTDESSKPLCFDIKSVDIIFNPEYRDILPKYRIPIFFKSNLDEENRKSYIE